MLLALLKENGVMRFNFQRSHYIANQINRKILFLNCESLQKKIRKSDWLQFLYLFHQLEEDVFFFNGADFLALLE